MSSNKFRADAHYILKPQFMRVSSLEVAESQLKVANDQRFKT
jgi:hypothetical protein